MATLVPPCPDAVEVIQRGAHAVVWKCEATVDGEVMPYAIKVNVKRRCKFARLERSVFERIAKLKQSGSLSFTNVVNWYSSTEQFQKMELCDGDVLNFCENSPGQRLPESTAQAVFRQALRGLAECHAGHIYHMDIKPENILLKDGTAKLADFGLGFISETGNPQTTSVYGTELYSAPETPLESEEAQAYQADKADIWAIGMALASCVAGVMPFDMRLRQKDVMFRRWVKLYEGDTRPSADAARRVLVENTRRKPAESMSSSLAEALICLLHPEPLKRPTAEEALALPFFAVPK